jgi:hypothetical protein
MAVVQVDKFNINKFWEKTPKALKYVLIISLIVAGSFYAFSKTVSISQIKQLNKIEESINTTYDLIDQFQEFEKTQYAYNVQTISYLKSIYTLIEELNDNTNKKFDMLLKSGGKNTNEIVEKLVMLNESFEKLQKAYTPEIKPSDVEKPQTSIKVTKITK